MFILNILFDKWTEESNALKKLLDTIYIVFS